MLYDITRHTNDYMRHVDNYCLIKYIDQLILYFGEGM